MNIKGCYTWSIINVNKSILIRLYRAYYEAKSSIGEMWKGNPALTAVLFGLPIGFLSLICYSICCADIMDAEEDEDDEPGWLHFQLKSYASSTSEGEVWLTAVF